jgi:hypothetical protein
MESEAFARIRVLDALCRAPTLAELRQFRINCGVIARLLQPAISVRHRAPDRSAFMHQIESFCRASTSV